MMVRLVLLALAGFLAQFVDGAMGMGYGVTSTSMLLLIGVSPAVASASVHLSEIGTNAASAIAHVRLGNVDRRIVLRLGVPGAIGAFAGATVLSAVSTAAAAPVTATLLAGLGVYILVRYSWRPPSFGEGRAPLATRVLVPLGLVGGFVDATGGGGWGPVTTTTLMTAGRTTPRRIIGSVSAAELMVSLAASVGFVVGLGIGGVDLSVVAVLLAGGVLAAPLAATIVSRVPARIMGVGVGGLIVLTNLRIVLAGLHAPGPVVVVAVLVVVAAWIVLVARVVRVHLLDRVSTTTPQLVGAGAVHD